MKLRTKIIDYFLDHYGYLRFRTNWHKHPWISKLMCYLGRYDYIVHEIKDNYVHLMVTSENTE